MASNSRFSATVTAKTGPAKQVTTEHFTNLVAITVDVVREVVQLFQGPAGSAPYKEFDLHGVTTITDTITDGVHVLVIS